MNKSLITLILMSVLSLPANADIQISSGGPDGTYIKLAKMMEAPLAKALDQAWVPQKVTALISNGGSPANAQNVCNDPNIIGLVQGNFEVPECAEVAAKLPASELTIAVVNPWLANKVENYGNNRPAVWQTVVENKDRLHFLVRNSGHLTTHKQVETMFGDLPEFNNPDDEATAFKNSTQVLDAISKDPKAVSIFTVFALPDQTFFKTVKKLGLVITPVIHKDMKTSVVNGSNAYSMSELTPVQVGFTSDPVMIQSAKSPVLVIVNKAAPQDVKDAVKAADFSAVLPKMGIMAKAALKIGGTVQSGQNSFGSVVDAAKAKAATIQ